MGLREKQIPEQYRLIILIESPVINHILMKIISAISNLFTASRHIAIILSIYHYYFHPLLSVNWQNLLHKYLIEGICISWK